MNDILIVVDMQKDFVNGSLGTKEAEAIVPRVVERIRSHQGRIIVTKDTHDTNYLSTQEGHHLPVSHCITGTEGWELVPEVADALKARGADVIEKPSFGSLELAEAIAACQAEKPITSITFVGLCTDICVLSNALIAKARLPEVPIYVDAAACAGVTPESHQRALDAMAVCQVVIVNG